MERAHEGIVTVHFYDLRHSQRALREIRERHMHQQQQVRFGAAARGLVSGRTVWAHFAFPNFRAVPEGNNQGSLVVFNLEPTISSAALRQIFEAYGKKTKSSRLVCLFVFECSVIKKNTRFFFIR